MSKKKITVADGFSNERKTSHLISSSEDAVLTTSTATIGSSYKKSGKEFVIQNFRLIWLDSKINEKNDDFCDSVAQLRCLVNTINIFIDVDQCIDFLTDILLDKIFLIVSGDLVQSIVPLIHDIPQVNDIFLISNNKARDEPLTKVWLKIRGVFSEISCIHDALKQAVRLCDQNTIPISFVSVDNACDSNLDELDQSFMYTQILKEILFEIEHNEQSIKDFANYCSEIFVDNNSTLNRITKFEQEYLLKSPIWWYTFENFIYSMLNRALRIQEVNTMIKMGFFINDLHQQIAKLHSTQFGDKQISFTVYRGQSLSNDDFTKLMKAKGGLLSFNNFLSTSEDRQVAFAFAESNGNNTDSVGILFEITIDTLTSTTPYARIDQFTNYNSEREVLLSMHTIFRIGEIKMSGDNRNLWIVELKMTSDNDPLLSALTVRFREETRGTTGWHRLGQLLVKLEQLEKAEEVYRALLDQCTCDEDEKASLFNCLGYIKQEQGDYSTAVMFYDKAADILNRILPPYDPRIIDGCSNFGSVLMDLGEYSKALSIFEEALTIRRNILAPNHPALAASYLNIGHIYDKMNDYSQALLVYEKAFEIYKKTLPPNHPNLAASYDLIAGVYNKMGEYPQALLLYKKALEIKQKTLPSDHPNLALSYDSIGSLYSNLGQYSKALSYLETSIAILQKSRSPNHPDLAMCYSNIGSTYHSMGEDSKALSFYEKTLSIQRECIPANHPHLADSYNSIGSIYDSMGKYSEALSFFEKALTIYQATFPANHLNIALLYNNIGHTHRSMGEYSKTISYCQKALEICQTTLPENHPTLLVSYHNIAKVYHIMNEYSKGLIFYQKALEIEEKKPTANNLNLALVYSSIAELYTETNEHSQSLLFYKKALEIQEKNLPPDHLDLAMTCNGIGTAYRNMGDPCSAFPFLKRFVSIAQPHLNRPHPDA